MIQIFRLALAMAMPLILAGCLLTPGKFTSTLDIRADRSFTFTYVGEVIATDEDEMENLGGEDEPDDKSKISMIVRTAAAKPGPKPAPPKAEADKNAAKMRELAATLTKEHGYRSVRYMGENVFMIDYRISGRLDHGFVFPFNLDAELMVPFFAIELRGPDRLRVKAPGYANGSESGSSMGMPGGGNDKAAERLDGRFTLTTDAEIVSQNQEEGVVSGPNGKTISWTVTPKTNAAPMAVLKVRPIP